MTERSRVEVALSRLQAAFPHSKVTKETLALYVEKLSPLLDVALERAVETAITKCSYFPKLSELLAFSSGKAAGQARAPSEDGRWPAGMLQENATLSAALSSGSAETSENASWRNSAIFEARRRAADKPVLSSEFHGCICSNPRHPHTLEAALEKYGLDWYGNVKSGWVAL